MAIRSKALLDAKFESKRNAEESKHQVLVKAILDAKEAAASFSVDVADIIDTYMYIREHDKKAAEPLWQDITYTSKQYGIDFANAFPMTSTTNRAWVFRTVYSAAHMVVSRNTVVLRDKDTLLKDLDVNSLSNTDAELFLAAITKFNEGFPKYVKHFFELIENI